MLTLVSRRARWILGLLPLVAILVGWELLGDPTDPSFPLPSRWAPALGDLNDRDLLVPAVVLTTKVFVAALLASTLLGAVIGMLLGSSRFAARALGPLLEAMRVLPPPAIVPVAVLLIGTSSTTTTIVVVFAAIWPVLMNTMASTRGITAVRLDVARTFDLSAAQRLRKIVIPSVVPGAALGMRVAAPICLVVTLVAEMLTSSGGVGQLLLERQRVYDAASVFGLLVVVGIAGLGINVLISLFERHLGRRHLAPAQRH